MQFKQIWANFPVLDTARTESFYSQLGLTPNMPKATPELASFIFGDNKLIIHFFRRDKLEASMGDKAIEPGNGSEIIFSISAKTEEEVGNWANNATLAGGTVITKAGRQPDGYYYCVFADPDGHKFNVLLLEQGM